MSSRSLSLSFNKMFSSSSFWIFLKPHFISGLHLWQIHIISSFSNKVLYKFLLTFWHPAWYHISQLSHNNPWSCFLTARSHVPHLSPCDSFLLNLSGDCVPPLPLAIFTTFKYLYQSISLKKKKHLITCSGIPTSAFCITIAVGLVYYSGGL